MRRSPKANGNRESLTTTMASTKGTSTQGTGVPSSILRLGGFVPTIMTGVRNLAHYKLLRDHVELQQAPYNQHTINAQYAPAVAVRFYLDILSGLTSKHKAHHYYTGHFLLHMEPFDFYTNPLHTAQRNVRSWLRRLWVCNCFCRR